jgi:phosphatidylglycerophosphatase A
MPASGTVAVAVAGVPLYWLMATYVPSWAYLVVTVVFTIASMALHHAGDKILGESDSRKLVWDELAGYMFAMFALGWHWKLAVVGFFLERFIDIVKVPPANVIDRKMHNGVGVVLDDVVAGIYTCGLLHLLVHFFPWFVQ